MESNYVMCKEAAEMVKKLNGLGNIWNKGDMHRFYIDLVKANEVVYDMDEIEGRLPMNRYERQNGKVWIDLENGTICTKGISSEKEMIEKIKELIEKR